MGPGQTPQDVAGDLSVYFGRKRVAKMNQSGSLVALRRAFFVGLTFLAGLPDGGPDPRDSFLAVLKLLHGRLTWDAVPDLDESAQGPIGGNLGEGCLRIKLEYTCCFALASLVGALVSRDVVVGVDCERGHLCFSFCPQRLLR